MLKRAIVLSVLAGSLGCGVIDGFLSGGESGIAIDCAGGSGCSDSFDCGVGDECGDLVCSAGGRCDDPDVAYSDCAAAAGLGPGQRTDDGDLLLYDLQFLGDAAAEGCFDFNVVLEDDAEQLDYETLAVGSGIEIRAVQGGPTLENIFGDEPQPGVGFLSFSLCGDAESFAFLISDDGRRSNTVCALRNFVPQGAGFSNLGGGGDFNNPPPPD